MVLHGLNLAARYADRLVALRAGKIVASGSADRRPAP
jgi:iron complex transport system ATP-binding protein